MMVRQALAGKPTTDSPPALAAAPKDNQTPAPEEAKKQPLELKLIAKKNTYTLDLGGRSADKFREVIAAKNGTRELICSLPAAPAVELVLELHNTGDKEIRYESALINSEVDYAFKLKGPDAVSAGQSHPEGRARPERKPLSLAPGQTMTIPVKSLSVAQWGQEDRWYWLKPGEYTLTAVVNTTIDGKPVDLPSNPITLKVVEPK